MEPAGKYKTPLRVLYQVGNEIFEQEEILDWAIPETPIFEITGKIKKNTDLYQANLEV